MTWYWWLLAALLAVQFPAGILLGRLLRQREDPGPIEALADVAREPRGQRVKPPLAPSHLLTDAAAERTCIWNCGCTIAYLRGGGTLFASCGTHRRHASWQAWEAQMTNTEGPA